MKKFGWLFLPFAAVVIALASCGGGNQQGSTEGDENSDSLEAMEQELVECEGQSAMCQAIIGVYTAELPCADCGGIATTLEFLPDGMFTLAQEYKDKDQTEQYEGTYTCDENKVLILTATSGDVFYIWHRDAGKLLYISKDQYEALPEFTDNDMTEHYYFQKQMAQ